MIQENATASPDKRGEEARVRAWLDAVNTPKPKKLPEKPNTRQIRKTLITRCCLLTATFIALSIDEYRHGLQLHTTGLFSSTFLFMLAITYFLIASLVSVIGTTIHVFKNSLPKKCLLILLLFPSAFFSPRYLPLPGFSDGAAHTLRKLGISDQLVEAAAEELAKPHDRYEDWSAKDKLWLGLKKKPPFSTLDLSYPHVRILGSSLVFEFGSPLANRWGFSISSEKDKPPTTPQGTFDYRSVSKEIVVFAGPLD